MSRNCHVRTRFCQPPAELARYFTTFYLAEIDVPGGARIVDFLHPEWGNLRFQDGAGMEAQSRAGQSIDKCDFAVTGPSSHALRFSVSTCRIWGVGLMPLGWAKFIGTPARDHANAVVDGAADPAFAEFVPLARALFAGTPDADGELARITAWFRGKLDRPVADEARIEAIHAALVDPLVANVADLSERAGVSVRTVERVCHRAFGFSPKLLLRRQRFMRSLAQFMLDPSLKWVGALDGHYHDQAQFVREFRQFMGMSPRQYAALEHPVLDAYVRERLRLAGSPVQTLDPPRAS